MCSVDLFSRSQYPRPIFRGRSQKLAEDQVPIRVVDLVHLTHTVHVVHVVLYKNHLEGGIPPTPYAGQGPATPGHTGPHRWKQLVSLNNMWSHI